MSSSAHFQHGDRAPPLVIDLGSHSLKMGFCGSAEPQMVYPNASACVTEAHLDVLGSKHSVEADAREAIRQYDSKRCSVMIEDENINPNAVKNMMSRRLQSGVQRGASSTKRVFSDFPIDPLKKYDDSEIGRIVNHTLHHGDLKYTVDVDRLAGVGDALWGLDASSLPEVIFTEPIPGQGRMKRDIFETAFETWMVPNCLSAPSQLFQAAGAATPSSLVVDVGHTQMTSCYVIDGYIHPETCNSTPWSVSRYDEMIMKSLQTRQPNSIKPLNSFFCSEDGAHVTAADIENAASNLKGTVASHPMPFTTLSVINWQTELLSQIIRESFSDDALSFDEMKTYVLPDGSTIETDATIYSQLASYATGITMLPKEFREAYGTNQVPKAGKETHRPFLDPLLRTAEAINTLHKTKTTTKRKTKPGETKPVPLPQVPLPERLTLTGGGSLMHKFDDVFLSIFHKEDLPTDSLAAIGLRGRGSIDFSYKTAQTAKVLWKNVQENPTSTNAILSALQIRNPSASNASVSPKPDPFVHIVSGQQASDRVYMAYRGASIIGSIGSFHSLTVSMEEYLEKGPERAATKMPI